MQIESTCRRLLEHLRLSMQEGLPGSVVWFGFLFYDLCWKLMRVRDS